MDWLGKAIGLPEEFLHSKPESPGGGVIQTTASESTFVCLLAGRTEAIKRYQKLFPDIEDAEINSRCVSELMLNTFISFLILRVVPSKAVLLKSPAFCFA